MKQDSFPAELKKALEEQPLLCPFSIGKGFLLHEKMLPLQSQLLFLLHSAASKNNRRNPVCFGKLRQISSAFLIIPKYRRLTLSRQASG